MAALARVLVAEKVEKSYGQVKALRGVDLSVEEKSIVGLVGPNGAGKTTLLKISLGIIGRDSGRVLLNGRDPLVDHEARRGVGVVFERPVLPDSARVVDVLERAARIHGAPRDLVREAVKLAGLEGHEWKRFRELSAGLKQRAAIAHALVANPSFIVADEPTSNLDPLERRRVVELVATLNRDRGITFLISSHVLAELVNVADSIVVISRGRVVAAGAPGELFRRTLIARIRAVDPKALSSTLAEKGFSVDIEGLSVLVKLSDYTEYPRLLEALTSAIKSGHMVLGLDVAGVSIEEVLKAE